MTITFLSLMKAVLSYEVNCITLDNLEGEPPTTPSLTSPSSSKASGLLHLVLFVSFGMGMKQYKLFIQANFFTIKYL